MSEQIKRVDTSCVPREERLSLWQRTITGLSGELPDAADNVRVEGYDVDTIEAYLEKTTIGDLSFCRIEVSPHRVAKRAIDQPRGIDVLIQLCGTSVFVQGDQKIEASPGDCLLGDFSRTAEMLSPTGTKHLLIFVPRPVALAYGLQPPSITCERLAGSRGLGRLNRHLVETIIEDREAINAEQEHLLADIVMRSLRLNMATLSARSILGARERLVERVKSFVRQNLENPELSLEMIAEALGCSKRYLHAAFAEAGDTITKYIWSMRLEQCRRELVQTTRDEKRVTDIAFSYGFNSSSHFSRAFKQKFGTCPSKIRH